MEELSTLIAQTRQGRLDAYDRLVRRFQDMAVGYAYSQLGDFHLAEDAAQEAFIQAYLGLDKLQDPAAFPGWFRRIVHSQCGRQRRARKPTADLDAAAQVAAPDADPAQSLAASMAQDELLAALDALPERDRAITALYYVGPFTQKEIAAFLDLPVSTVNNRLHLSRKRLKQELTDMTAEKLRASRPSRDEAFAARIGERLQAMENLHRDLAAGLGQIIGTTLDAEVRVDIAATVQTTFDAFIQSLAYPSLALHQMLEPSAGRLIFDLSPELAHAVEEKLVGLGAEDWSDAHTGMSQEQWNLFAPFGHAINERLIATWKPVFAIEFKDPVFETGLVNLVNDPRHNAGDMTETLAAMRATPDDPVVRVDFAVAAPGLDCRLSLCYPAAVLETLLPHLN